MDKRTVSRTRARIRGSRWLLFDFDDDHDACWPVEVCKSEQIARFKAQARFAVMEIPARWATTLVEKEGVPYETATVAGDARKAGVHHKVMTTAMRRIVADRAL